MTKIFKNHSVFSIGIELVIAVGGGLILYYGFGVGKSEIMAPQPVVFHTENSGGNNLSISGSVSSSSISQTINETPPKLSYYATTPSHKENDGLFHSEYRITISSILPNERGEIRWGNSGCALTSLGMVSLLGVRTESYEAKCTSSNALIDEGKLFWYVEM